MAAVSAGARQVECTINGIGERAGNAALEEIVMAMRVRHDRYPYQTGIEGEHLFAASQMLSEITGVPVQPNKAVTGRNAFAHEAGIHQDGVLKNPLTYEIMTPQSVGVPDSKLVLGKHSGRHALAIRCEQLGHQFDRRAESLVVGRDAPDDFDQRLNFNSALLRLASEDATVHQIMSQVTHLVKPYSALRDPQIVERVTVP